MALDDQDYILPQTGTIIATTEEWNGKEEEMWKHLDKIKFPFPIGRGDVYDAENDKLLGHYYFIITSHCIN